ncbi:hypothetical protein PAQ31011_01262 [Pandoraea aquatica]|uniref:Uncharacterized protein n=1 Tax=Pandoraea aquatica TaxID=2508290 RepID=A0A5E4TAM0_9BURK|nr:hypothetical protein [Pandoraea aquatica]VVD83983.1 hypothetical protein PAQ31011_01262 [Pandoraea aquatica]
MRADLCGATASANVTVPAKPADAVDPGVINFLRAELVGKHVVLIDCMDEAGRILADAKDRMFRDMAALEVRRQAGGSVTARNTVVVVCGGADECLSIRYALCEGFAVFDIVTWPDKITLCSNQFGIGGMETAFQEPSSILKTALSLGRDDGKGANVLSYGGRHTDAMMSAGFPVTYPLHRDSVTDSSPQEWAAVMEFEMSLLQRITVRHTGDFQLAA